MGVGRAVESGGSPKVRRCIDCPEKGRRPAPFPGPRCATHDRIKRKAAQKRQAARRALRSYGVSPEDYGALLEAQRGRCALCGRRIGVAVRAAIDHDHSCRVCGGGGCRECVRGLVDRRCNLMLGTFGDDPVRFEGVAAYLRNPPAKVVLQTMTV
jgi:hypothetical protein